MPKMPAILLILVLFLQVGCATAKRQSPLLSLFGVDEEIANTAEGEVGGIYDAITLLKRGEAHFVKEEYAEAQKEFQQFLTFYPSHRMASFGQYQIGMSAYAQVNSPDRDPEPIARAIAAFQQVITLYPESPYVDDSQKKILILIRKEGEHQFQIGRFYHQQGAYPVAIRRLQTALAKGVEGKIREEALYVLGRAYLQSGDADRAKETFTTLVTQHPTSRHTRKVMKKFPHLVLPGPPS